MHEEDNPSIGDEFNKIYVFLDIISRIRIFKQAPN
jgi:hypothetical protein